MDSDAATLDSATVTNALGAGATTVSSLTTSGDLLMTEDAAVLTHSAASGTSLAISSTNGYVSIGGSYVDVESVRFTDAKIGVSGDPDLITLTSGDVAVAGTLSTTGAATLNSATVTNALGAGATSVTTLTTSGAATLASATVTGSLGVGGATGDATKKLYVTGDTETTGDLAIGGDATFAGTVTVTGTFTALGDYRIGDSAPSDSLTVNAETNHTGPTTMSDTLDVVGATTLESSLALSADSAAITHSGSTSLAISSTNGYVSIAGSYVDVESVRITDAKIGVSGDPDLITLTSGDVAVGRSVDGQGATELGDGDRRWGLGGVTTLTTRLGDGDECADSGAGATTVSSLTTSGDLLMTEDAAVLTHSAASGTSLAISSTNGYVSIGGSYVDVESVRITDAKIGVSGDPDLITLTSGDVAVAGTLSTTGAATLNSATVTNALGAGATSVTLTTSGVSTRRGATTTSGDLLMTEDAAVLTHSAASGTSLAISSTNGYVSIGGSYVDVESVRITDAKIGVSGDPDLITLTSGDVARAGAHDASTTTGAATLDSATVTNALGAGATTVSSLTTSGDLLMTEDAAVLTHSAASGTSLAISSTNGYVSIGGSYVDVESVRPSRTRRSG